MRPTRKLLTSKKTMSPSKPLTASPEYNVPPISPLYDSHQTSPLLTPKTKTGSRTSSPSTSSLKGKSPMIGMKKPGTRGKCRGCVKRDSVIESHVRFLRTVVRRADRMEEISAEAVGCFFQIQEYLDIVAPLVNDLGKRAGQLSLEASMSPNNTEVIDLENSS